jgi:hypothetical protein
VTTEVEEPRDGQVSRSWFRRSTAWLFAVVVVAVVVTEGFALNWGDSSTVANAHHAHTITTIVQPNVRLCPSTNVQFIEVEYLRDPGYGEKASVTGHVVTIHCGGFDDFHFVEHATPLTVYLSKDARLVLMTAAPSYYSGNLEQLNEYLSVDFDGNVFAVTGPNSDATGLVAIFHP